MDKDKDSKTKTKETSAAKEEKKEDKKKDKALELALSQVEKQYGKGSIMRLGTKKTYEVESIPTGCLSLDLAVGTWGIPRGKIIEIYGPESSGKTTIALHVIAEAQKTGGTAAFVDAEHALDPAYASKIGINLNDLLVSQPDYGEQALEITDLLVRSNAVDTIIVDSVAALVPKAEIEGEMGDSHMGLQARLMSQAMRKLAGSVNRSKTCLIFINQIRQKIGVMFGNPETTTGGNALKFYSSVRMDVRRIATLKTGDETIGTRVRVKVVKNKIAPPFRKAEFDIMFNKGISQEGSILDLGVDKGVITKSGSWYSFGDERLGQGRESAREELEKNQKLAEKIRQMIISNIKEQEAAAAGSTS